MCKMKKREIFPIWHQNKKNKRNELICQYIFDKYNISMDIGNKSRVLQVFVSSLCKKIDRKWQNSQRKLSRFIAANETWLESKLSLPEEFVNLMPSISVTKPQQSRAGRPVKNFLQCHPKVKKRKLQDLLTTTNPEELTVAAEVVVRKAGKRDAANIIKELASASPKRATKIKKARKLFDVPEPKMSPEQALSLIVDAKLSTSQYETIRQRSKSIGCNIYPPYHLVQKAKLECYPPEEAISVTETSAEIELQALLDMTIKRICLAQKEVFEQVTSPLTLRLITKWGCDGSSAQSRYKQTLSDSEFSDEHLFSITLVPLRLIDTTATHTIYWQNLRANSTRFCRLVRFVFKKETKDVIKTETSQIKRQIANLLPTQIRIGNCNITCSHELVLTMTDGKICSTLSQYDSSQKCYICGAGPKEMNQVTVASRLPDEEMYSFGISPLHSWIRCFECIIHISYKLDIKKWQARTPEEKTFVATKKATVQQRFRSEMGLLIDVPKQTAGNTNDGNTARRFFRNPLKSAEITGIDADLIYHFRIILEALSSGLEIDAQKFQAYAEETKEIYLRNYSWYYMPASVHKILQHAEKIIQSCILPLGQLSEEAQESSNKEYRRFREHFSRKCSRINTNKDVLNRFLISSDPLLSSYSTTEPRRKNSLPTETIALLKAPENPYTSESDDCEEDEEESDENVM